jgi:hypothetical protein
MLALDALGSRVLSLLPEYADQVEFLAPDPLNMTRHLYSETRFTNLAVTVPVAPVPSAG